MTGRTGTAKRVVAYLRVSTDWQKRDGVSLGAQRAKAQAWAAMHGYTLAEESIYTDAGLSGKTTDRRKGLQAALEDVCSKGGVLIVYSLSRLARSVRDTLDIAERLSKADADLVSLSEQIDTTSATGRMVFGILAVLAEFERELTVERTASALAFKRKQGERVGSVPFGFRLGADGVRLEEDPIEMGVALRIHRMRFDGMTIRRIVDQLNGDAVQARGSKWHLATVQRILSRPMETHG